MTAAVSPFVSTAEAARLRDCDESTIRRRIRDGQLRAERHGRNFKVYRADVDPSFAAASREEDEQLKADVKKARELVAELNVVLARIEA